MKHLPPFMLLGLLWCATEIYAAPPTPRYLPHPSVQQTVECYERLPRENPHPRGEMISSVFARRGQTVDFYHAFASERGLYLIPRHGTPIFFPLPAVPTSTEYPRIAIPGFDQPRRIYRFVLAGLVGPLSLEYTIEPDGQRLVQEFISPEEGSHGPVVSGNAVNDPQPVREEMARRFMARIARLRADQIGQWNPESIVRTHSGLHYCSTNLLAEHEAPVTELRIAIERFVSTNPGARQRMHAWELQNGVITSPPGLPRH